MKYQRVRKIISFISSLSLVFQTFLPLTFALPVYAEDSTPSATVEPTADPTPTLEPTDTPTPTLEPIATPTSEPTPDIDPATTATPTAEPAIEPVTEPTADPTVEPTADPTPAEVQNNSPPSFVIAQESATGESDSVAIQSPETSIISSLPDQLSIVTQLEQAVTLEITPTLSTDKTDYFPTDTVYITGSNFLANTTYTLHISSQDKPIFNYKPEVTSDENGNISFSFILDGNYRPNYKIEALDSLKDSIATYEFTDSAPPFNGAVSGFVGATGLAVSGNTTGAYATTITGTLTEYSNPGQRVSFSGTVSGDITGSVTGGVNYNGADTLYAEITGSAASGHVYLIGQFDLPGDGNFSAEFITRETSIDFVDSITVSGPTSVSLGGSAQMSATLVGGENGATVAWGVWTNSSDPAHGSATIDRTTGVLTATGVGDVTVIASALDGSLVTKNYVVTVTAPEVTSVVVKTSPTKTVYTAGETLDLSGLVVTLTKSDSTTQDVAFADFTANSITTVKTNGTVLIETDTAVVITVNGHTANQTLWVGNIVTGISIKTPPTKVTYNANDLLDLSGLVVTINKQYGSVDVAYADFTAFGGFTTDKANGASLTPLDTSVVITYGGFHTTSQAITVNAAQPVVNNLYISGTGTNEKIYATFSTNYSTISKCLLTTDYVPFTYNGAVELPGALTLSADGLTGSCSASGVNLSAGASDIGKIKVFIDYCTGGSCGSFPSATVNVANGTILDNVGPTNVSTSYATGLFNTLYTESNFMPIGISNYSDTGVGGATAMMYMQSAPYVNGVCNTFTGNIDDGQSMSAGSIGGVWSDNANSYWYSNLDDGQCHRFDLVASDMFGNTTSYTGATIMIDTQAPTMPNVTTGIRSNSLAYFAWDLITSDNSGINHYEYAFTDGKMDGISSYTSVPNSQDDVLVNISGYGVTPNWLHIKAIDNAGNTGSENVFYLTQDSTAPTISITNPDSTPAQSKTVTASVDDGTLTMAINASGITTCNNTLTFVSYTTTTFNSESDNGKTICYKAVDVLDNTAYLSSASISGIDTTIPVGGSLTMKTKLHPAGITVANPDGNGVYAITPALSMTGLDVFNSLDVIVTDDNLNISDVPVYIDSTSADNINGAMVYDTTNHIWNYANQTKVETFNTGSHDLVATFSDIAGNSKQLTVRFITDNSGPTLTITGFTANGSDMPGNLTDGYTLDTNNDPSTDYLIQFWSDTSADETLSSEYFGLTLKSSTVSNADLKAYYDDRGTPDPFLSYLKDAVDGTKPFAYINGNTVKLVDAAKHDLISTDVDMTIPGDYPLGTYVLEGKIKDLIGNETTVTYTLIIAGDRVAPTIDDVTDIVVEATGPSGAVATFTPPMSHDAIDGDITSTCNATSGSTFALGDTTVTCSKTDTAGNTGTSTFTITVQDTTAPVITINGFVPDIEINDTYTEPGATATDTVDGTFSATKTGSVTTTVVGSYDITYDAVDAAGNHATSVVRTVKVIDSVANAFDVISATLAAPGSDVANNLNSVDTNNVIGFTGLYFEKSISGTPVGRLTFTGALDLSDTDTQNFLRNLGTILDQGNGSIDFDARTSDIFRLSGATLIMYNMPPGIISSQLVVRNDLGTILDPSGIISGFTQDPTTHDISFTTAHFTKFDIDTTAPTIDTVSDITEEATGPSGAVATFTPPMSHDAIDGDITSTCNATSGSTFALGITTVTCSKTDTAGNVAASETFTITVEDTTAPTITPLGDNPQTVEMGSTYTDPKATFYDVVDGTFSIRGNSRGKVNTSVVGTYTFNYEAEDDAGNTATPVTRIVYVVDTTPPELISAETKDTNDNGKIDAIELTFSEAIDDSRLTTGADHWDVDGYTGESIETGDHENDDILLLHFDENSGSDSGSTPIVTYTKQVELPPANSTHDLAGNQLESITYDDTVDATNPVLLSAETQDTDGNGKIDSIKLTFSEKINDDMLNPGTADGWDVVGYTGESIGTGDVANDNILILKINEGLVDDDDATPTISYTPSSGSPESTHDFAGNELAMVEEITNDQASPAETTSSSTSSSNSSDSSTNPPVCNDTKPSSAPILISAIATGLNEITLRWSKANNPVTYYLVAYGSESGEMLYGNSNVGGADTTTYTIKGLSGGQRYYFKVRAGNNCMPGDYSNEMSAVATGFNFTGLAESFIPGVLGTNTVLNGGMTLTPTLTSTVPGEVLADTTNNGWNKNYLWLLLLIPLFFGLRRQFKRE